MKCYKPNAYSNEPHTITKLEEKVYLKHCFDYITSCLENAKKEGRHLWWLLITVNFNRYNYHTIGGINKQRTGRLSSHLGLLDNELQERLDMAQGKSYRSWKTKFGILFQTYKEGGTTWVVLKEQFDKGMGW